MLVAARLAVALLPFRILARLTCSHRGRCSLATARRVSSAIRRLARMPGAWAHCLPQALAAHWMLARRGVASTICLGVSTRTGPGFAAHAWLLVDGITVLGGESSAEFQTIAQFPHKAPLS